MPHKPKNQNTELNLKDHKKTNKTNKDEKENKEDHKQIKYVGNSIFYC